MVPCPDIISIVPLLSILITVMKFNDLSLSLFFCIFYNEKKSRMFLLAFLKLKMQLYLWINLEISYALVQRSRPLDHISYIYVNINVFSCTGLSVLRIHCLCVNKTLKSSDNVNLMVCSVVKIEFIPHIWSYLLFAVLGLYKYELLRCYYWTNYRTWLNKERIDAQTVARGKANISTC